MENERANPDEILRKIKEESRVKTKGHLKIFFGYAAGVGKTYAMLKAAHVAQRRGVNVLVGYVEPHTRPQTIKLLEGLEQLPKRIVNHNGILLNEFDLDEAIQHKPQLVIVDELAHTNAPTCRHIKRYQDINELLKAGIDVYTSVNVQHIESLNDIVASITGVMVRERIPDHIFDDADQVELVDIEPRELIERLNEGKIYKKKQAEKALKNFFEVENLVALREIALRRCADRVNKMSEKVRLAQKTDYYTDEHILVCLSSSPTNPKIIRTAARMANAFKGNFTALFVETTDFAVISEENKNRLRQNMQLAKQLGATVETIYGDDIALQIAEFARLSGVSKIVLGRNNAWRKNFFCKPSLTEQLILAAPNLDVHIIPDQDVKTFRQEKSKRDRNKIEMADILKTIITLIMTTIIGYLFYLLGFSEANIITVYILGVLILATVTSQKMYSMLASAVSVLAFNFFFTVPRFSLQAYDQGYPVTFLVMLISAFITSSLATKIKQHAKQSAEMAYRTSILLETNQMLAQAKEKTDIISVASNQLVKLLKCNIIFYDVVDGKLLNPIVFKDNEYIDKDNEDNKDDEDNKDSEIISNIYDSEEETINSTEKAVAAWTLQNNKRAGATTNTLGGAKNLYLAVRVMDKVYGVVGISIKEAGLDSSQNSIALSILGECALALEKDKVSKEREEAATLAKNEQLRANLLRSISHDLRTPLTSISGNAGVLLCSDENIDRVKRKQLYTDIYDDSLWLINLVENLLSVTRIEDGSMNLHLTAELINEVIEEALTHINRKKNEHKIKVIYSEEFILAKMDVRLIVQVIINILDNAIKYTQVDSEIVITTFKKNDKVIVEIADNGDGIKEEAKAHIFEMFYTANEKIADSRRGMGLGLALCKSILVAHGGDIFVRDNTPKGTVFQFELPHEEVILHE